MVTVSLLFHNHKEVKRNNQMRVTFRDLAREAGVSVATVARYLNKSGYVSEDAEEKLAAVCKRLGYDPLRSTRFARRKKTYQLGLLTSFSKDIFNSRYHTHLLAGIMNALYESEYNLKIIFMKEKDYSNVDEILKEHALDGLFILTWRIHPKLIQLIQTCPKHLPVMLFNDYDPKIQANFVYSDVTQGIQMAVDHMVEKGRKKIAFLKGPTFIRFGQGKDVLQVSSIDACDKWEGFQKGMAAHNLPIRDEWVKECDSYSVMEGYKKAEEILKAKERPDAIVCSNDEMAVGVLTLLRDKKIKCPEEISVIGFDGIEKGELTMPPLTTVEQLLQSMGYEGGKKLIDIAEGRLIDPIHTKFVPRLIEREST